MYAKVHLVTPIAKDGGFAAILDVVQRLKLIRNISIASMQRPAKYGWNRSRRAGDAISLSIEWLYYILMHKVQSISVCHWKNRNSQIKFPHLNEFFARPPEVPGPKRVAWALTRLVKKYITQEHRNAPQTLNTIWDLIFMGPLQPLL